MNKEKVNRSIWNYYLKTKKLPEHNIQHTSTEETFPWGKKKNNTINPKKQKVNHTNHKKILVS